MTVRSSGVRRRLTSLRATLLARGRQARLRRSGLVAGDGLRVEHAVEINGRGSVLVHDDVWLGYRLSSSTSTPILLQPRDPNSSIVVGSGSQLSNGVQIIARASVIIGERARIGPEVVIYDSDFHGVAVAERQAAGSVAAVVLGDDIWLGTRAIILKGVHIGDGAVVAAGAVVTSDVAPGAIVAGNPARVVGQVPGPGSRSG